MRPSHILLPKVCHAVDTARAQRGANFIAVLKRPLEKQQIFAFLTTELLDLSRILWRSRGVSQGRCHHEILMQHVLLSQAQDTEQLW